jgi:hypothetical protein
MAVGLMVVGVMVVGVLMLPEKKMAMQQEMAGDQMRVDGGDTRHSGRSDADHTEHCACQQKSCDGAGLRAPPRVRHFD